MGRAIAMENQIEALEGRVKKMEDTLQEILDSVNSKPKKSTPKKNKVKKVADESVDEA